MYIIYINYTILIYYSNILTCLHEYTYVDMYIIYINYIDIYVELF